MKGDFVMRTFMRRFLPVLLCLLVMCPAALAYNTLEKGDRGSEVLQMQQALSALGYAVNQDGSFGTETRNVVKAFQRDHHLTVDGKAGDKTLTALYTLYAQLTQTVPTAVPVMTEAPAQQITTLPTATVYCPDGGKLNLRSGAGTGYSSIGKIASGETVIVLSRGSKWSQISHNGKTGYAMSSFLRFAQEQSVSTPVPAAGSVQAVVTIDDGGKLNLRAAASSGSKVLARIPDGTLLNVQVIDSKWCATAYNGESGYVMRSFLSFNVTPATPTPAPAVVITVPPIEIVTPSPAPDGLVMAVVKCDDGGKLNLRERMASGSKILDRIPDGTMLAARPIDSKWCAVTYNGQSGYVMRKYLVIADVAAPTATPAPVLPTQAPEQTLTATVRCANGGKLNLRAGAGTGYKVLYQIPNASIVTVITRGTTWCEVRYGTYSGYVSSDYLVFGSAATATPTPSAAVVITPLPTSDVNELQYEEFRYGIVQTTSGSLNVRRGPGANYARVSDLKDGTQVVVRAIQGDWCAIYYGDISGYVMRQYLVISAPSGSSEPVIQYDTSILTRVLRADYTGDDVRLVQARLVELKYLSAVTGSYDPATIAAVKAFQKQHNLTQDGLVGANTVNLLFDAGAIPYSPSSGETFGSYVIDYNGNTSAAKTAAVQRAQTALRALHYDVPLTGAFEARTHDAIVAFQLRNGITASGVLDSATQQRLYSGSAHDVAWPSRYYLPAGAGTGLEAPVNIQLLHWGNDVKAALSGQKSVIAYEPQSGLSWTLSILSRGRHLDVQPATLEDTLIQKKAFGTTSWDIHPVYILLPDGRWSLATMHDYPHGSNTIMSNGFGGQNCVHFLRDMDEAQRNDPNYGVNNQKMLREAWYALTGVQVN